MIINVHAGHNYQVPGAGGEFSETKENRNVKNKLISYLRKAGHTVYDCTDESARSSNNNLYNIVQKCNAHTVDLDVSIHFNAYDGSAHGTEVWVHTGSTVSGTARRITERIAALGFTNRGVKETTKLYVITRTNAPALLVECCFCDSPIDAKLYDADRVAKAIAEGIINQTISSGVQPVAPYQVKMIRNSSIRQKARKTSQKLGSIQAGETEYTIVEVSRGGNWGKLKSGAGWIPLKNTKKIT